MSKKAVPQKDDNALRSAIVRFMKAKDLKPTPWAAKADVPESTLRSFLNGQARAPRHDTLEKLAGAAGVTIAEMIGERPQPSRESADDAQPTTIPEVPDNIAEKVTTTVLNIQQWPRDVPILGVGSCGEDGMFELNGQVADYVRRPPLLMGVRDAYALWVMGNSMFPWRKNGGVVYVHPHRPISIEDFVVVQLRNGSPGASKEAYIKQLVRRTARDLRLRQFNPNEDLTIPMSQVSTIHRVLDWDELVGG